MSDDFQELSSLSELDFNDEPNPEEEYEEFHAPVEHTKGTSLESVDQDSIDDFNYIRKVYLNMIESGQISIEVAIRELKASGHPRAAEVVGGLIKQIADVSTQLIDLNDRKAKKSDDDGEKNQTNIQNNFYGSPNDLLEVYEEQERKREERREKDLEDIEDAEFEENESTDKEE